MPKPILTCKHTDETTRGYGHAYDPSTELPTENGLYTRTCPTCGVVVAAPTADQADVAWAQLVAGA